MIPRRLVPTVVAVAAAFAAAPSAGAAEPPIRLSACYEIAWGGIGFADLRLSVIAGSGFTARTEIETFGLVDLFGPFRFDATSQGRLAGPGLALPGRYVSLDGHKPEKRRRTVLDFDPESGAVAEELTPPRDQVRVAPALRVGTVDPLTAVLQARGAIRRSLEGGPGTVILPIYDGSKRYDFVLDVHGRVAGPAGQPAIRATARVRPIAGFRPRQLDHVQDPAEVVLSDDVYLLPLRVQAGWSSLALVDRRSDGQPCRS
ncbi:MAG TPA: DUF3108 domain-containing protein [Alphaproteobacteria bacterium]